MKATNLAVRFVLELCALAALCYWGAQAGDSTPARVALAVLAPLAAATAWGVFVSPKRRVDIAVVRWVVELSVFGCAASGLLASGHSGLALALAVAYAVNRLMLAAWRQDTGEPL